MAPMSLTLSHRLNFFTTSSKLFIEKKKSKLGNFEQLLVAAVVG